MIQIAISQAALDATAATLSRGAMLYEPQRAASGGVFVWLPERGVNNLAAVRGKGEDYMA
jgi:hypothetical protein